MFQLASICITCSKKMTKKESNSCITNEHDLDLSTGDLGT